MGIEARRKAGVKLTPTSVVTEAARRAGSRVEAAARPLPAEIAFLAAQGVGPDLLLKAARVARETGVTADEALLGEGFPADTFQALLARHLGLPFVEEAMRPSLAPGRSPQSGRIGIVPLAPNARGLDFLLAPRGQGLRALLRQIPPGRGGGLRLGITTGRRLDAMLRAHDGARVALQASHGLGEWDAALSARTGLWPAQMASAAVLLAAAGAGLVCYPAATLAAGMAAFSLLFFAAVLLRLVATAVNTMPEPGADPPLPDHALPVYTVVVPLYREAAVVGQLVGALDRLDYPRAKLDIKLMVEADDPDTLAALRGLALPDRYDIVVAPPGRPQTKPRALNIALTYARGDLLVVYDAEDIPDPGQLRAAAARFRARPSKVACLQARLLVDHVDQTWVSLMFGLDYASLFGVVKPGLAALGLPLPLGGTSNHFRVVALRRAGAWDAWNVTEDIDLGYRLARVGYAVEALDSTTFEEAPLTLSRWLPQRTRWLKGWMVTLMVHTRQPLRLFRELGVVAGLSVTVCLFGTVASCLFGPLFVGLAAVAALRGTWLAPVSPADALWSTASLYLLGTGALSLYWPQLVTLHRHRRRPLDLLVWSLSVPVYLALVSVAAWRALGEAVIEPQRWNKTEHGLARRPLRAGMPV